MTKFEQSISDIKNMMGKGGDSSKWFAQAYVSWYRSSSEDRLISLAGVERLDDANMLLFYEMINLRRDHAWNEMALYNLELYAIENGA